MCEYVYVRCVYVCVAGFVCVFFDTYEQEIYMYLYLYIYRSCEQVGVGDGVCASVYKCVRNLCMCL